MIIEQKYIDRFWTKVDKSGDCWEWLGANNGTGYGHYWYKDKVWNTHRFSWIIKNGEIPAGLYICHHCDNRLCVNPEHLFLGTAKDNMQDASRKGRLINCGGTKGENHGMSKLTKVEVLKIREYYPESTLKELAEKYDVIPMTIWRVVKRISWNHV